jgi:Fe-S-cluster containining protein
MNIDLPSTWIKYRKGLCDGCWAGCCTLPVEVSAHDLLRLGLVHEDEISASLKKVARRLMREGFVQRFHAKTGLFILEQKNGTDCVFLGKDRLCTVYDKRPEVCRKFPTIGPRPGYCPARQIKKKSHV